MKPLPRSATRVPVSCALVSQNSEFTILNYRVCDFLAAASQPSILRLQRLESQQAWERRVVADLHGRVGFLVPRFDAVEEIPRVHVEWVILFDAALDSAPSTRSAEGWRWPRRSTGPAGPPGPPRPPRPPGAGAWCAGRRTWRCPGAAPRFTLPAPGGGRRPACESSSARPGEGPSPCD
jgi:hypothetical protein